MPSEDHPQQDWALLKQTRRHFFGACGVGVGRAALGLMLADGLMHRSATGAESSTDPLAPKAGHFAAKAKNVIFLFMAGGPSQLELFDNKPVLRKHHGEDIPASYLENRRFAFMDRFTPKLLGAKRKFARHGECGMEISELLPHTASMADEISLVKTVRGEAFNHAPAKIFANTGSTRFGRPSMGAWILYGLGSESQNLPGFVVLQSGPRGPRGGASKWASGFLSTAYQGVPLRNSGDPIVNLSNPASIDRADQQATLELIQSLNQTRLQETGDEEIATRMAAYEMAFRMQTSAPELIDFSDESQATLDAYGASPGKASFANNCLLARRLVERGTRFVQLYHTDWDHHGGPTNNLDDTLERCCRETDQPAAALIRDLKQRGLLKDTLVVWGGEFGRTPMSDRPEAIGRNHHIECGTMWMAGGGIQPGRVVGTTDELGFLSVEDPVDMHDIHATILHCLGLDHLKLTHRFQGRDYRLTDVHGKVIEKLL